MKNEYRLVASDFTLKIITWHFLCFIPLIGKQINKLKYIVETEQPKTLFFFDERAIFITRKISKIAKKHLKTQCETT